ncbi:MAG: RNA polymerase sigma factor [Candidatus Kapabacteria bacterium]|nr:RNA polymerase sigma factor [Ignavibacteriota bacterium]MCW5883675.1 RNA polymerase sigma factor [Candidatus Kapabacteria bacterium]
MNLFCVFKSKNPLDAEEIFEDTWLKFLDRIRQGKIPESVLSYLFAIARNLAIDRYRAEISKKTITIEYRDYLNFEDDYSQLSTENLVDADELKEVIMGVLSNMDDIYSEVFIMQWFGGLTQREISETLNIGLSAVKMRSHRAMKEVIKYVKPIYKNYDE